MDIPVLAAAARHLAGDGLIRAYLDDLESEELALLDGGRALDELADPLNWWRDEEDPAVPPADHLVVLDITSQGQQALMSITYTPGKAGRELTPRRPWYKRGWRQGRSHEPGRDRG